MLFFLCFHKWLANFLMLLPFVQVLAVTVKFIQKDAEEKKTSFNPRPYFRLFMNWILDLCSLDPVFDGANFQVLQFVFYAMTSMSS